MHQAKAQPEEYEKWWRKMGIFVKEGVCTEEEPRRKARAPPSATRSAPTAPQQNAAALAQKTLKASAAPSTRREPAGGLGEAPSVRELRARAGQAHVDRGAHPAARGEGGGGAQGAVLPRRARACDSSSLHLSQKFLVLSLKYWYSPINIPQSREQADASPYLEAFRSKGTDVLLLYSPADDIVMKLMLTFKGIRLVNAEDASLEADGVVRAVACALFLRLCGVLFAVGRPARGASASQRAPRASPPPQGDVGALSEEQADGLTKWLGETVLAGRVQKVATSKRLVDSPAVLTGIMSQSMRQLQRAVRARSPRACPPSARVNDEP